MQTLCVIFFGTCWLWGTGHDRNPNKSALIVTYTHTYRALRRPRTSGVFLYHSVPHCLEIKLSILTYLQSCGIYLFLPSPAMLGLHAKATMPGLPHRNSPGMQRFKLKSLCLQKSLFLPTETFPLHQYYILKH